MKNKKALELLVKAMVISGKNPDLTFKMLKETERFKEKNAKFLYHRGYLYYKLEQYKRAIVDFNEAISIIPDYKDAIYRKACCNRILKNYQDALDGFDLALKLDPDNYVNYWSRGRVKVDMFKFKEALIDYNKALSMTDSPNLDLYSDRGVVLDTLGKHKEAMKDYIRCIENNNNDYVVHSNLGVLYSKMDKLDKSEQHLNKAIEINPKFYQAFLNRSIVYQQMNKLKLAIDDLNKCEEIYPDEEMIYINRAQAYIDLKDYVSAERDLNTAQKYNPDCSLIYSLKSKIAKNKIEKTENYKKYVSLLLKRCNNDLKRKIRLSLYCPINKNTISSIKEGYLWFSHPDAFNDPLESNYCNMSAEDNCLKEVLGDIRIRSFSFVDRGFNQLLWAHYADKFSGMMIEYEIDIKDLNKKNVFISNVEYKSKLRPQSTEFDSIDVGQSYFIKYKDWKYENEWRLITLQDNLKDGNKLYDAFKILSITFGLKTSKKDIEKIVSILPDCRYYILKHSNNGLNGYFKIKREIYN